MPDLPDIDELSEQKGGTTSLAGLRARFSSEERAKTRQALALLAEANGQIDALESRLSLLEGFAEYRPKRAAKIPKGTHKRPLSAIFCSSDTHWQENIPLSATSGLNEHNPEIGRERIRSAHEQLVASLKRRARTHDVGHLTYWMGGDDLVNADMHGGLLGNFVDSTPLEEMEATYQMRLEEFRWLEKRLDVPVRVVATVSNHDRDTPQMQAGLASRRSYDMMIASRLAKDFSEWEWHLEPTYYAMSTVGEFTTAFHHGHAKRASVKVTACGLRTPPWSFLREMQMRHGFNLWVQGHRHSDSFVRSSSMAFSENGCTCGPNGYSTDEGYVPEPPSQSLLYIDHTTNTVASREVLYVG